MYPTFRSLRPFGVITLILFGFTAQAAEESASSLAIGGYSPVSYFSQQQAELGDPQISTTHQGKLYYFTNQAQRDEFLENPEKFVPRYGELCPYSLALGMRKPVDPTNFKIINDRLYLFHRDNEEDGLKAWEGSKLSDKDLLERAEKQFVLLRF